MISMDTVLPSTGHKQSWSPHLWLRRFFIIAAAFVINLALFGLMPYLLTRNSASLTHQPEINRINVIRLKHTESPVKRNNENPPKPPPERQAPKPAPPKPVMAKLTLPFDVNPRLPGGPDTLSLPVVPATQMAGLADIFSTGDLDSPLVVLVRIPPIYPMSAKNRGAEGWVKVRFIVHEDGGVGNVSVIDSNPKSIFDDAVVRSVSGWRFKAGTIGGVPVKTWAETVVRFKLD
jgi:periplasmic protein TonB